MVYISSADVYYKQRNAMVDSQLRTNNVKNAALLDALSSLPREVFLPSALANVAYIDEDLVLPSGYVLMEPRILARLLQAATPKATDMALVIGAGTAYEASLLDRLVSTVTFCNVDDIVRQVDREQLNELGVDTVDTVAGNLGDLRGLDDGNYDLILVVGALADQVPESLTQKLSDGGRLVAVLYDGAHRPGSAILLRKEAHGVSQTRLFEANTPLLPNQQPTRPVFTF